jgi:hypothetical protein
MLETHLSSPVTRRRLRTGPAAAHIDAFADWLHRQGYKPSSIDNLGVFAYLRKKVQSRDSEVAERLVINGEFS